MGEHSGTLYLDGKPIEDIPELSICDGNRDASLMMGFAFCGDIAVMERPATTCKTRKRFVKLLMAHGYSRNEANKRAERARRFGYSYQDFFFLLLPLARIFRRTVNHDERVRWKRTR